MNTSERQALLSAFKQREQTKTLVHCAASGIAIEVNAPNMAPGFPLVYSSMSPFACIDTCIHIAKQRYSESHCKMAPTVLAGILIVLLDHYELRKDKLSTTEANLILSRVPPFELSQALSFLSELPKLSTHKRNSIPAISLSGLDYRTLSIWRISALTAINTFTSTPETTRIKRITKTSGKLIQDASVTSETIKEARELLKQLKEDGVINQKLNTILTVVLQKNNLTVIAPSLRTNLLAALEKLGTTNCLSLAKIIKDAGQQLTYQEKAIATDLGSGEITNFPPTIDDRKAVEADNSNESRPSISSDKPMSLLERIKASKKQQQRESAAAFIALAREAATEIEEVEAEVEEDAEGTSPTSATENEIEENDEDSINEAEDEEEDDSEDFAEIREELDFSDSFMRIFDEQIEESPQA